ncbi:MAG: hypothetical protein LQ342_000490, partial [Letrouitia transgressa]
MAISRPSCPSTTLLRSLAEDRPTQKGFHGQLYESTLERVRREREEQERFNKLRSEDGKGRPFAILL